MKIDFSVRTDSGSYPVYVRDSFEEKILQQLFPAYKSDRLFLVIDQQVHHHFGSEIRKQLELAVPDVYDFIVQSGEGSKSIEDWNEIVDYLLQNGARRNTPMVAVGGGVTGDLAGFAASATLRGLPLIHIPTTLLAMVDSSIGGKTGINHSAGKNLIGAFYQPDAIYMNTALLSTLPRKEWVNGLSEIIKYAAIRDPAIFWSCQRLFLDENNHSSLQNNPEMTELIRRCAKIKADVVGQDEKEQGLRMILNFGHTFAHALEKLGSYREFSHGEAVFAGMLAALKLSNLLGASLEAEQIFQFRNLYRFNDRFNPVSYPVGELIHAMQFDKKRVSDQLKFVLLQDWGQPYVKELSDNKFIEEAWNFSFDLLNDRD